MYNIEKNRGGNAGVVRELNLPGIDISGPRLLKLTIEHGSEDRARPRKTAGADKESRLPGTRSHNEGQVTVGVDGNGSSSRLRFGRIIFAEYFERAGRHCLLLDGKLDGCRLRLVVGLSPRVTFVVVPSRQKGGARWCRFGVACLELLSSPCCCALVH